MTITNQDFTHYCGNFRRLIIPVTKEDGTPLDLADIAIYWAVALKPEADVTEIHKTIGHGIVVQDPSTKGICEVTLRPEDTARRLPGEYYHEAWIVDADGHPSTIATGTMLLKASLAN